MDGPSLENEAHVSGLCNIRKKNSEIRIADSVAVDFIERLKDPAADERLFDMSDGMFADSDTLADRLSRAVRVQAGAYDESSLIFGKFDESRHAQDFLLSSTFRQLPNTGTTITGSLSSCLGAVRPLGPEGVLFGSFLFNRDSPEFASGHYNAHYHAR